MPDTPGVMIAGRGKKGKGLTAGGGRAGRLLGCSRGRGRGVEWVPGLVAPEGGERVGDAALKPKALLELVGRLSRNPGGRVGYMALHGNHVYLVNEDAGLQVVDVSNPAGPKVVGSYQPSADLGPVATSGNHVYLIEEDNRLRVLDVANPARPRVVGSSDLADQVAGLAVAGKHVYAVVSDSLRVLDVSNPALPKEVG